MIGVWSLWTKPVRELSAQPWANEYHHQLSWILSVQTARRHFSRTSLITDDAGARLLVDGLGLEFDSVSTELNRIETCDAHWWSLGKLHAYAAQTEPFVHIDADVFLWKPLPRSVTDAPVFAQNFEPLVLPNPFYDIDRFRRIRERGAWLPPELDWLESSGRPPCAINCGILGGNDIAFFNHYARSAIRLVLDESNLVPWELERPDNLIVEQFYLAACLQSRGFDGFHGFDGQVARNGSGSRIACLFRDWAEAFDPAASRCAGFTHLIGPAKRNPYLLDLVERRVAALHPQYYERCRRQIGRGAPKRQ